MLATWQPVTYVAACDWEDGRESVIEKPYAYEYFRKLRMPYDKYPVLSMYGPDSSTGKAKRFGFFDGEKDERGNTLFGLFTYRRIVAASRFKEGYIPRDVTLVNWPQNDYFLNNVFGTADDAENLELSRQLTLSLVYWLQTEGGYRGLGLNTEVLGTNDGLAMQPYIRESRRIRAKYTVTAEEIADRGNPSPADLPQSVGVGLYHIDLHITTKTHTFFFAPAPAVYHTARLHDTRENEKSHSRLQKRGNHAPYERLFQTAPRGVEYRGGCGIPRGVLRAGGYASRRGFRAQGKLRGLSEPAARSGRHDLVETVKRNNFPILLIFVKKYVIMQSEYCGVMQEERE